MKHFIIAHNNYCSNAACHETCILLWKDQVAPLCCWLWCLLSSALVIDLMTGWGQMSWLVSLSTGITWPLNQVLVNLAVAGRCWNEIGVTTKPVSRSMKWSALTLNPKTQCTNNERWHGPFSCLDSVHALSSSTLGPWLSQDSNKRVFSCRKRALH